MAAAGHVSIAAIRRARGVVRVFEPRRLHLAVLCQERRELEGTKVPIRPRDRSRTDRRLAGASDRVTMYPSGNLPAAMWPKAVSGVPRRTVRMIAAAHVHNARCAVDQDDDGRAAWHRSPADQSRSTPRSRVGTVARVAAERRAAAGPIAPARHCGRWDGSPKAAWQNFPNRSHHFLNYFVAHERSPPRPVVHAGAPDRGTGLRSAREAAGLWQWTEAKARMNTEGEMMLRDGSDGRS